MTTEADLHRTIGRLENAVTTLTGNLLDMQRKVEHIDKTLTEARGGWRTLMWLGGGAAAVGGVVGSKFSAWFGL